MGMFDAVSKAFSQVGDAVKHAIESVVNEEEFEGVVAAAVLMAYADGNVAEVEREAAFKAISGHAALQAFAPTKTRKVFDEYVGLMAADAALSKELLLEKVSVIKDRTARIKVLGIAQQIANADGDFSDAEKKMVDKIRSVTA